MKLKELKNFCGDLEAKHTLTFDEYYRLRNQLAEMLEPETLLALLDVVEAAQNVMEPFHEVGGRDLRKALKKLKDM